jgi:hypothetical protein
MGKQLELNLMKREILRNILLSLGAIFAVAAVLPVELTSVTKETP